MVERHAYKKILVFQSHKSYLFIAICTGVVKIRVTVTVTVSATDHRHPACGLVFFFNMLAHICLVGLEGPFEPLDSSPASTTFFFLCCRTRCGTHGVSSLRQASQFINVP